MGRAKDLGSLYRLDEQATKDMLDRILEDEEDKELGNKFKLKELSSDSVLTICDRKMLEEYIINPMKSDFPIYLTNTTTLTSNMLRFCNNKVIIAYRTGRDYCELLKREVNLYRVKSCNTDSSFSNSGSSSVDIECYIFPDILFKEFWKNKEHEKIMRKKASSKYSKALNLEKDFLNSLESAVKDKNSYIYQKNKYSIYTEDDFFNEDIRMFMLYISPRTNDHYFVYSKRCQDRLFSILGIERDEYVTIDVKAMNKQLIKVKKDSCFPHILKNIKFTAHSVLIDKNKVPYILVCIQHVIHNMIYTSSKAIAIPFSMINKVNEPNYREVYKDNEDKLKILDIMDKNDINVNEFFYVLDDKGYCISTNRIFYFNENLNLRVVKEADNRNRLKINNKLPKTVEERILKRISKKGYVRFSDMNEDILTCLSSDFGYFPKGAYVMNVEVLSF